MSRHIISCIALIFVLFLLSLFVAAPTHAGWRSLTGLLPAYTNLEDYQISPDGQWIVFEVYRAGRYELRVSDGAEGFYTYLPVVLK